MRVRYGWERPPAFHVLFVQGVLCMPKLCLLYTSMSGYTFSPNQWSHNGGCASMCLPASSFWAEDRWWRRPRRRLLIVCVRFVGGFWQESTYDLHVVSICTFSSGANVRRRSPLNHDHVQKLRTKPRGTQCLDGSFGKLFGLEAHRVQKVPYP